MEVLKLFQISSPFFFNSEPVNHLGFTKLSSASPESLIPHSPILRPLEDLKVRTVGLKIFTKWYLISVPVCLIKNFICQVLCSNSHI